MNSVVCPPSSAVRPPPSGTWFDRLLNRLLPSVGGEIVVRIAPNAFGGWSIYAANDAARRLLGGDEPTGNFGTYADAHRRAVNHNCWTVQEGRPLAQGSKFERRGSSA